MLTKYEAAKKLLELRDLPPKQLDNLEVLESQIFDIGLGFYGKCAENTNNLTLEQAIEKVKELAGTIDFLATMHLVVGCDIHHFRAISLARFIEVPPEMQIDDIISRLTTRDCDTAHNDAIGDVVYDNIENKEKGKEERKEKGSPHTPHKEKGKEESEKEPLSRARVKIRRDDPAFMSFFNKFWERYPRKVSKQEAKKGLFAYWKRRVKKSEFENEVLTSLDKWRTCEQWKDPMYIPHPSTWVHQKRWMVLDDSIRLKRPIKPLRGVSQTANVKSNRAEGLW